MDLTQLKEKSEHENEKAKDIAHRLEAKDQISIRDFYPELKLNGVYGYYVFGRPVYTLIPYLDNVIINLPPYKNEVLLKEKLGVDLDTLLELVEKARVSLTLDSPPSNYKNLDYLDPILEYAPSSEIRNSAYLSLVSDSYTDYMHEAQHLFSDKLTSFSHKLGWNQYVNRSGDELEHTATGILAAVGALGYQDIYSKIANMAKTDPDTAYRWAYYYSTFLTDPVLSSLDGITPFDRELASAELSAINWSPSDANIDMAKFMDFPTDVGRTLLKKLDIHLPKNLDVALEVESDKLRRLLHDIDIRIEKRSDLKFEDAQMEIERVIDDVLQSFESIESVKGKVSNPKIRKIAELSLGVTGLAAMFMTGKPLFLEGAMLGISMEVLSVPEMILEKIMRFRKPSHIVAMLDIRNRLSASRVSR